MCIGVTLAALVGASPWEGAAAVAAGGELPENGLYIATNSFPVNTVVDITNLENEKTARVIVSATLDTTGLMALLSQDAADAIGLQSRTVGQISMTQSADPQAAYRFSGGLGSGDPDNDPAAFAAMNAYVPPPAAAQDSGKTNGREVVVDLGSEAELPPLDGFSGITLEPKARVVETPQTPGPDYELSLSPAENRPPESGPAPDLAYIAPVTQPAPDLASIAPATEPAPDLSYIAPATEPAADLAYIAPAAESAPVNTSPEYSPDVAAQELNSQDYDSQSLIDPSIDPSLVIASIGEAPAAETPVVETPAVEALAGQVPAYRYSDLLYELPSEQTQTDESYQGNDSFVLPGPVFSAPLINSLETGKYYLQIAAYSREESVRSEIAKIDSKLPLAIMNAGSPDKPVYRVLIGPVNLGESGALLQRFKATYKDAFIRLGS